MKLSKSEVCPIHHTRFCCGREKHAKFNRRVEIRGPVTRIDDPTHPRGYIEVCTKAEIKKRLMEKLRQSNICGICGKPIVDVRDAVADHIEPQPSGCLKDSHRDNLQPSHKICNLEKGSQRSFVKVSA
jgi:hypothetical protein